MYIMNVIFYLFVFYLKCGLVAVSYRDVLLFSFMRKGKVNYKKKEDEMNDDGI